MLRQLVGREASLSTGIIASRSIKSSHHVAPNHGIDGNKKVKGCKEHIGLKKSYRIPLFIEVLFPNYFSYLRTFHGFL